MPIFHLRTNVKDVPESFITKVSKEVATLTNKEEAKVMVTVEDNIKISLGSSDAPAAVVQFHSVGMKVEHHAIISESIANLLKDIGVPHDRHYIQFYAPQPTHVGKLGTTIAELNKPKENVIHF